MAIKTISYEVLKERSLQDPEVRAAYEDLEPAYQVARLRIMRGLTQAQLAERVGTKQPNIARLESGRVSPSLGLLRRVAEALGARVVVRIEPASGLEIESPASVSPPRAGRVYRLFTLPMA